MVKRKEIKKLILILALVTFIFLFPFFARPKLLTTKDNDIGRSYTPIYKFINNSIFTYHQIPLWRPDQMMGETLIGNPISNLFYPANLIFLVLPTDLAIVVFVYLHIFLAAVFTYSLAKSLGYSNLSCFAAALFYALSTKMLVHLEAGHLTMIAAFAYFPLAFLSLRQILKSPNISWTVAEAVALSFMYINYPTVFYYAAIFLFVYFFYKAYFSTGKITLKINAKKFCYFSASFIIFFCLSAIHLLPQLEFGPLSTRSNLRLEDVAIPLWNIKKFLISLFFPYLALTKIDHEAFLYVGIVPGLLSLVAFFHLSKSRKLFIAVFTGLTLVFAAGISTPLFKLTYQFLPLLKYSRVTTRPWFVVALIVALLSAYVLDKFKSKAISTVAIAIFIIESLFIFYARFNNLPSLSFNNEDVYQYLASERGIFRVYCASYCFNPQLISNFHIQTLDGETPIQDSNFIKFLEKAGNYQFDKFAVIFPPYQVWQNPTPPSPNASLLGQANVKYVVSTYQIENADFEFVHKFDNLFLYKNTQFMPRAHFADSPDPVQIVKYTPNEIQFQFSSAGKPRNLIVSEKYYPGWQADTNGKKLNVLQLNQVFRQITIPPGSESLVLKFRSGSFLFGSTLTVSTVFLLMFCFWYSRKKI